MLVDPWPTSTCNARSHSTLLCPHMLPGLLPHSFIYKELCDYIERKQIIQYNLLISTSLIYSHLQNLFCEVPIPRFQGLQCTHAAGEGGGLILPATMFKYRLSRLQAYIKGTAQFISVICGEFYRVSLSKT